MAAWRIKLLYDGQCPLCKREIEFIRKRDRHGRIALEDITAPDFDADRYGLTFERAYGRMHAVLPDGQIVEGMEVFRRTYAELGWGWLLKVTGWPILRPVFDRLYLLFAKVRPYLSAHRGMACRAESCETPQSSRTNHSGCKDRAGHIDRNSCTDRAA